jgi:hypothetical protein
MRRRKKKVSQIQIAIRAEKDNLKELKKIVERFRKTTDPEQAKRLANKIGRMVFG